MGATEVILLIVVVIGIPLAIAVVVTLWSLKQVQYRPKRRPKSNVSADAAQSTATPGPPTES